MSNPLEISKVLTLSTSHITEGDDRKLQRKEDPNIGTWFALRYQGERDTVGYLIAVYPDDELEEGMHTTLIEEDWSEAIVRIQFFAKAQGCDYIRLDPDGPVVEGLEVFQW